MTKTNYEWLSEKLTKIVQLAEKIPKCGITTNYREFTALKLIVIHYYADVFLKVITAQKNVHKEINSVYVDLFAGTGLVKLKGSKHDDYVPGSPICVSSYNGARAFDYIVCVEYGKKECEMLEKRLSQFLSKDKYRVIQGDVNQEISEVIEIIKQKFTDPFILTFVDPEGLDIEFSTLKKLTTVFSKCDVIVNVNSGISRAVGKAKKDPKTRKTVEKYFDDSFNNIQKRLDGGTKPEDIYEDLLKNKLDKLIGYKIEIKDNGDKTAYHMLGYTRKTKGNSGYMNGYKELKRRLKNVDKKRVRLEIEKIAKRQHTLDMS